LGVNEVLRHDAATDQPDAFDRLLSLGNDRLPLVLGRVGQVDGDHSAIGRREISSQVKDRTRIAERGEFGVVLLDHRVDRSAYRRVQGIPQIGIIQTVVVVGTLTHDDQEIAPVFGDHATDKPRG
jgi:hypothetical protein